MLGKLFKKKKSLTELLSERNKLNLEQSQGHRDNSFISALKKSSDSFKSILLDLFRANSVDHAFKEKIEEALLRLDFGVFFASKIAEAISSKARTDNLSEVNEIIKQELLFQYGNDVSSINFVSGKTNVFLIIGSNGSGKTTSVAKLAHFYKKQGKRVLIVAADTFRAGAIDQLKVWADRLSVDIFLPDKDKEDPSAVIYRALSKALESKNYDLVICDTSGRQHNNQGLLREISKVHKTIQKFDDSFPNETLLIIDSTVGQSNFLQVKSFLDSVLITGIILTKMDNLSRGGIIFSIKEKFQLPVKWMGIGEALEDFEEFKLEGIVDSWLTTF